MNSGSIVEFVNALAERLGSYLPSAIGALAILVVGGLLARGVATVAGKVARRTLDSERLMGWVGDDGLASNEEDRARVSEGVRRAVFWILCLVVFVAFFSVLRIPTLSESLSTAVGDLAGYLPNMLGAAAVLGVAWLVARLLRTVVKSVLSSLPWVQRLQTRVSDESGSPTSVPEAVSGLVFWLVLLFAIPAFLEALSIQSLQAPFQGVIDQILQVVPGILVAAFFLFIGVIFARIIRNVVVHFLDAVDLKGWLGNLGLGRVLESVKLHAAVGTVVYVLVLLPVVEHALDKLSIHSIAEPLRNVIDRVVATTPGIATFLILVALGFLLGRWIGGLLASFLGQIGLDQLWGKLGWSESPRVKRMAEERKVSEGIGHLAAGVITLILAAEGFSVLGMDVMSGAVTGLLAFLPDVLLALVVLAIAVYLGGLAADALDRALPAGKWPVLPAIARAGVILVGILMGLNQLSIGGEILDTAFVVLLASTGLGLALAFGLGGRAWAERRINNWDADDVNEVKVGKS